MEVTTSERQASGGEAPKLPAENLVKAFYGVVDRLGDDLAIRDEARGVELSWNELRDTVHRIAGGLSQLGVKKGDTVAIMLGNRWEFIPCDLAAVSLGAIPFSVYQTYAPEQVEYLLSDAESKLVITEQAYLDNVNEARKGVSTLERVIVVDGDGGDLTLDELDGDGPGVRSSRVGRAARPRRPLDADLHLGDYGTPEGCPAHASQPTLRDRHRGRADRPPGAGRQGDLLAAGRPRRRAKRALLPARHQGRLGHDLLGSSARSPSSSPR